MKRLTPTEASPLPLLSCAVPAKVPAQLSGPVVKSLGRATDVVVTLSLPNVQRGTGQYEVGAAHDAPALEAEGALLDLDAAGVIEGRLQGRGAAARRFQERAGVGERAGAVTGPCQIRCRCRSSHWPG